jgi:hypothetical protein
MGRTAAAAGLGSRCIAALRGCTAGVQSAESYAFDRACWLMYGSTAPDCAHARTKR